ncbi:MAG: tetratricopeptide repeat protein [Pseudomonadota bacterium]
MQINRIFFIIFIISSLFSTSLLIADNLKQAKQAITKNEYSSAIIHLKNQLKKTPEDAQARFLLGDIYLRTGKVEASLKELGRAHKYAPDNTKFLFRYTDALQATGKYTEIVKALSKPLTNRKTDSQRLSYLAYAHLGLKQLADAKKIFEQSNKQQKNAQAYNGLASLALMKNELKQAENYLSQSLEVLADNPSTVQLKAKLANLNKQPEQALAIYNQLIKKDKFNLSLYLERAATFLILNKNKQAKADIQSVLGKIAHHPQANLLLAKIRLHEQDYQGAIEAAQKVLNVIRNNAAATFILGAANFALKHYNQADNHLTTYLSSNSYDIRAQSLLANVYLAQQKPHQAILILEAIPIKQQDKSPLVLLALADSYIRLNKLEKAIGLLTQAKALVPANLEINKRLITAKIQAGNIDDAIIDLEKLLLSADFDDEIHYLLITSYIKQKQLDKAITLVNQLLSKKPNEIKWLNFDAMLQQQKGNTDLAIKKYKNIIKLDKKNIPAYIGLSQISISQSKWKQAEEIFKQVLAINPDVIKAYLALAAIAEKQQQPDAVEKYFKQAITQLNKKLNKISKKSKQQDSQKNKQLITAKLAIAKSLRQWYNSKKQTEKIMVLAKNLKKQHPDNDSINIFLVQSYLINKDFSNAEVSLNAIIESNPKNIKYRLLLANLIAKRSTPENNRTNQAIDLLNEAISIEPENKSSYIFKTALLVKQKNYNEALIAAKLIQDKFSDLYVGKLLEADIYRAQKQFKKALPIYKKAYKTDKDKKILNSLVDTLIALKQDKKAIKLLTQAVDNDPADIKNLFILAALHQKHQQTQKAQQYYKNILKISPKHIAALNNFAWLYLETDRQKALELAQRAYKQAPKSAAIMDTYGYFLAKDGQHQKAVKLLQQAFTINPDDNDIQYHLAFAYNESGRRRNAIKFLNAIVNAKASYTEQENARKLLKKINKL